MSMKPTELALQQCMATSLALSNTAVMSEWRSAYRASNLAASGHAHLVDVPCNRNTNSVCTANALVLIVKADYFDTRDSFSEHVFDDSTAFQSHAAASGTAFLKALICMPLPQLQAERKCTCISSAYIGCSAYPTHTTVSVCPKCIMQTRLQLQQA
eukprot:14132-Heterococcus_DN1.PRE.4